MKHLLLVLALGALGVSATAQSLPPAGVYDAPLRLELPVTAGSEVRYRFLETPSPQTFAWPGTLVLDALPGEVRNYGLRLTTTSADGESQTRDLRYQVRRATEPLPSVQPEPGLSTAAVTIHAQLPTGWRLIDGTNESALVRTLDAPLGQTATFALQAIGPNGQHLDWTYSIDRRDQEANEFEILSPREGVWANAQTLAVQFRGVDKVVWGYGDAIDPARATDFLGPVLLDHPGVQTVTVAARSRLDGRWLQRRVTWTNGDTPSPADWPPSGVRSTDLVLPAVPNASVSWDQGRSWQSSRTTTEAMPQGSGKVLVVQVRQADRRSRYFYWLDARAPESPTLSFGGGWNPRVTFSGTQSASYRATWVRADGKTINEASVLWGPVGSWKVPDGVVGARVQAVGINGVEGPLASVGFAETGWSTPRWEPWDQSGPLSDATVLPLGGRVLPRPGFWPVYEVSDRPDVSEPNDHSALLGGAFLPVFPWGSDRTLYVRFAWRDAAGLVGPASVAAVVRIDRVPPSVPEVMTVGGQVLIKAAEGEEEGARLFWAQSGQRAASADSLTFQPYTGPLTAENLRREGGLVWIHALAQDRSGNSGPARLNVALPSASDAGPAVVQVNEDPSLGETAVEDGGVYPWSAFRLRALDQGHELWVGVTDQGTRAPSDWATRVQPWAGVLSRGIARGERRTFVVFWNAKTADGWTWTEPRSLVLTLDLSAPQAPLISGRWPTAPQASNWTLALQPARTGDSLRYTFSLDGSEPADPLTSGEAWPGTRTWEAPPLSRLTVRVRIAAVSVSGLGLEMPKTEPVVLDRTVPDATQPALAPFVYRTEAFTVPAPTGLVRYTVTSDGSLPEVPTESSERVPTRGLLLEGKAGESLLYRLRWRSFSSAGVPGPVTDAYGILIDRTASTSRSVSATGASLPAPALHGLPSGGVSAAPVTLDSDGPAGLVRYELREGWGSPRPVAPDSALWSGPLVIDSGEGRDRTYAISLRIYSAEGTPLSEEATYQLRVDRSTPARPELELTADSRRPEASLKATTNADETLSYRWLWDALGPGPGQGPWTRLDAAPAVFTAPGGTLTRLRVQAFLTDEAGNTGPVDEQSILVDQNVVYVVPQAQASGTGTRQAPLGSLVDALERARLEGKTLVLAAAGNYLVARTLDLTGFRIIGGLDPTRWEATSEPGRSLWSATAPFAGDALLVSGEGEWSLTRVDLNTAVPLTAVVQAKNSRVTIRDANWVWAGSGAGWLQEGGSVDGSNLSLVYFAKPRGTLLDWSGLDATMQTLRIAATGNQDGLLVSLKDANALFRDLVAVSKKASGFDGAWSVLQSRLTVDQARIQSGDGADRSTAFVLKNSDAVFWNTDVSLYAKGSNTGFQSTGGRLELQKGSLSLLAGLEFNQAFVLDGTAANLHTFDVKLESGAYQGAFSVDGGSLLVGASKIRLAGGGKRVWGGQFFSSVLVTLDDVQWVLAAKTPGDLFTRERPWADGSRSDGSDTSGW